MLGFGNGRHNPRRQTGSQARDAARARTRRGSRDGRRSSITPSRSSPTKGAEGTSLRAIAEKIGVSHAALLHYFGSREELLVEVLREGERRHGDPRDRDEVVGTMVRAAERNVTIPGFVSLYTSMLAGSLEADKELSREYFATRFGRHPRAAGRVDQDRARTRAGSAAASIPRRWQRS